MNTTFKIAIVLLMVSLGSNLVASETKMNKTGLTFTGEHAPEVLKRFINAVVSQHPRLLEERARLQVARLNLLAADQSLYNPELEIDTEKTDINTSYLQLSQTIDISDKRGARTSVAKADYDLAKSEFEISKQKLVFNLLSSLSEHYTKNQVFILIEQNLQLMKDFAKISEQRHNAGDLSQVELNLARLAYNEAIMTHTLAAADASSTKEKLQALIGAIPKNIPPLPITLPKARISTEQDSFISSLPAMQIEQAKVNSARKTVALRQSEKSWDPTISIRGGTEGNQNLTGITLAIPLNIRNSFNAEVQAAQQHLIQTEYNALQSYREQRAIVNTSTKRFSLIQQAWRNWNETGKTSIQDQLKLIKRLWRLGYMSTTDYLVQLKQTIDTQTAGLELRGQFWQSAFEWMNTTSSLINWLNINININKLETSK